MEVAEESCWRKLLKEVTLEKYESVLSPAKRMFDPRSLASDAY